MRQSKWYTRYVVTNYIFFQLYVFYFSNALIQNLKNKFKPNTTACRNELLSLGTKPEDTTGRQWLTTKIVKIYNKYNVPFPTTRDGLNPVIGSVGRDYTRLLETKWDITIGSKQEGITYQEVEDVFDQTDNAITRDKVAARQEEFHKFSNNKQQKWSDQNPTNRQRWSDQNAQRPATFKDATKSTPAATNKPALTNAYKPRNDPKPAIVQRKPTYNANMLEIEEERIDDSSEDTYTPDASESVDDESCPGTCDDDDYYDEVEMCVTEVNAKPNLLSAIFRWEGVDGPIECQVADLVNTRSKNKTQKITAKPPLDTKTKPRSPETWTASATKEERQAVIQEYQKLTRQRKAQQSTPSHPPADATTQPADEHQPVTTEPSPTLTTSTPSPTPCQPETPETAVEPKPATDKPARRGRPPKQQQQQQQQQPVKITNSSSSAAVPLQPAVLPASVLNKLDEVSRQFSISKTSAAVRLAAANVHFNLLQMLDFYRSQHSQKLLAGLHELFAQAGLYKETQPEQTIQSLELVDDNQELEMLACSKPTADTTAATDEPDDPVATLHALLGVMLAEGKIAHSRHPFSTSKPQSTLTATTTKPTRLPRSYPTGANSGSPASKTVVSTEVPTGILYPAKVKPGITYSAAAKKPVSKLKIGNTSLPRLQWRLSRHPDSKTYQGVIDSGATVSAIDAKWATDHLENFLEGGATLLDIQPLNITGFSGHGVEVTQMLRGVKLHIGVGVYPVNLYLVPGLGTNKTLLLGADFQYQYNLHIEWQQDTVWLGVPEVAKGVPRSQIREHGLSKGYQCVKLILSKHYHQVLVEKETKPTAAPTPQRQ